MHEDLLHHLFRVRLFTRTACCCACVLTINRPRCGTWSCWRKRTVRRCCRRLPSGQALLHALLAVHALHISFVHHLPFPLSQVRDLELLAEAYRQALLAGAEGLGLSNWAGRLQWDEALSAAMRPGLERAGTGGCRVRGKGQELVGVFIDLGSCSAWHGLQVGGGKDGWGWERCGEGCGVRGLGGVCGPGVLLGVARGAGALPAHMLHESSVGKVWDRSCAARGCRARSMAEGEGIEGEAWNVRPWVHRRLLRVDQGQDMFRAGTGSYLSMTTDTVLQQIPALWAWKSRGVRLLLRTSGHGSHPYLSAPPPPSLWPRPLRPDSALTP